MGKWASPSAASFSHSFLSLPLSQTFTEFGDVPGSVLGAEDPWWRSHEVFALPETGVSGQLKLYQL